MRVRTTQLSPQEITSTASGQREFEHECCGMFGELVDVLGIPRSVGQIYGALFASPRPLSFSDVVERLEISKGSASQGLQLLRSLGAINISSEQRTTASSQPTPRAITYEPELSLRQLMTGVLRERLAPLAAPNAKRLSRLTELAEQTPGDTRFYLERVEQLESWRRSFTTVMPVLTTLLGARRTTSR